MLLMLSAVVVSVAVGAFSEGYDCHGDSNGGGGHGNGHSYGTGNQHSDGDGRW